MRSRSALVLALVGTLALGLVAFAAERPTLTTQDFTYDFERSEVDFKNDIAQFFGHVRVTQGTNSIEAQQAVARAFRSENKQWEFRDAVLVKTAEAELTAQSATAAFENNVLVQARVEGSPAHFERRADGSERLARGRARSIEYDVVREVVTLSGDVWFGYGSDEFRGDTVVYDLRDERVRVDARDTGRVRGVIRPRGDEQTGAERQGTSAEGGTAVLTDDVVSEGEA